MIVNYDEEMRKALESMKDAPYDYFTSGCWFCGDAVEWALKTIDSQRAEIERLKTKQQPMIAKGINGTFGSGTGYCPSCGTGMHYANYPGQLTQHYCDQCGQAVKWSD